jgi:hypothetical protein
LRYLITGCGPYTQDKDVNPVAGITPIPDDVRWRLAAEFSAHLPALYDAAFRPKMGEEYDRAEQEVWIAAARSVFAIAKTLSLPVKTPTDLAGSMATVLEILFGPGYKSEVLELSGDRAVIVLRRCPLMEQGRHAGVGGDCTFTKCMALVLSAIPQLNGEYSARFVRSMCTGDRQCEIKIARETPKKDKKNEKK